MKKIAAAAFIFLASAASMAVAGPIEDRQQLMKSMSAASRTASGMARGTTPFDAAQAKTALQVYIDASAKIPTLFPAGSDTGAVKTSAAPAIWTDASGFKAAADKLGADAKAAMAATDTASFADAFKTINADCSACHTNYRVKQQ